MTNCASIAIMTLFVAYIIQVIVARQVSRSQSDPSVTDDDQLSEAGQQAIGNRHGPDNKKGKIGHRLTYSDDAPICPFFYVFFFVKKDLAYGSHCVFYSGMTNFASFVAMALFIAFLTEIIISRVVRKSIQVGHFHFK